MRYDKEIYFVEDGGGFVYDPVTGRNEPSEPIKIEVWANVTSLGTDRNFELFGDVNQSRLVIRLLNHYTDDYTSIEIDKKPYRVITDQKLRRRHTLIVEEGA